MISIGCCPLMCCASLRAYACVYCGTALARALVGAMFSSFTGSPLPSVSLLNASARRSLHNTSLANRSLRAEETLKETAHHVVKALSSPVPVQVQETLRGDLSALSVKLHVSGWAWLVCDKSNRVLLWRYAPVETAVARCFQLDLPSLFHTGQWNAELITICGQISSDCISVLGASPDGHLHYWDNILRERSSPSANGTADVGTGHVTVAVPVLGSSGVVLFTSDGSLFHVHLPAQLQPTVTARALSVPQGLLSGFSRRVSSLFFGSSSGAGQRAEGRGLAVRDTNDGCSQVFVLINTSLLLLQKWTIQPSREQMVYELSLEPLISSSVIQRGWFKGQLTVWSIDIALAQKYAVVLFAVRLEDSAVAEYGLALFDVKYDSAPHSPDGLVQLHHRKAYESGREASLCSLSLHSSPSSPSVTVHDKHTSTLLLSVAVAEDAVTDVVHFPSSTSILGTGNLEDSVVLFTTAHGVISVHLTSPLLSLHPPSPPPPSLTHSSTRVNNSLLVTPTVSQRHLVSLPPETIAKATEKLKDAFIEYLDGNTNEASVSAHELFSTDPYSEAEGECVGDVAAKTLSEMIVNEQPALDQRWGDSREALTGGSLIIIYHLEEKQAAHLRLLQFISNCGLLKKLSCVTERGQSMRTTHLLCEHAEKLAAAIALRKAHNNVVDVAMKACVSQRSPSLPPGLSHQDIFFTEVTRLGEILPSLVSLLESRLQSLSRPKERLQLVLGACTAIEGMLREAVQYRRTKASLYTPPFHPDPASLPPYTPWTASSGSSGARNSLSQLLESLYDAATRDVDSHQEQAEVWRTAVGLCDTLLGGYLDQIQSMEHNPSLTTELAQLRKRFESTRERFLSPLLNHGQYDQGIELAERYHDFQLLVRLCERAGDRERLKSYVVRFAEEGFAEFLFKQHLDRGQLEELLSYSEDFPRQLTEFLKPHDHISWLHHLATQDYPMAHATLHRLAQKEEVYLAKKKTQLSLSKLALLACGSENGDGDMQELDRELRIIKYQRNIPASVVEALGVDVETMAPLPLADIVQLYVGEKNTTAEETDFLCALELLQVAFEDNTCEGFCDLRTYIWSQAALRDNWSQMSTDNPLDQLPHTLMFRIIQAAYDRDFDLSSVLPTVEELLASPSLLEGGVAESAQFRFLVSAGFEQLRRVQDSVTS